MTATSNYDAGHEAVAEPELHNINIYVPDNVWW